MNFYFTTNTAWTLPNGGVWKPEALLKVTADSRDLAIDLVDRFAEWEYVYDEDSGQSLTQDETLAVFPAGVIDYNDIIV